MSKFESRESGPCYECKWCDTSKVFCSNPPKYYCNRLKTYVYCNQSICEEDKAPQEANPIPSQGKVVEPKPSGWETQELLNNLKAYTDETIYKGVRGGGGSFLPPEGYINGKEREIRARLGRIEKRLKEQGEKKNGIDKRVDRLEAVVNSYDAKIDEYGRCARMASNGADVLKEKIAKLDKGLTRLATIVRRQLDERRDLMWVVAGEKIYFLTNAVLHKELNGEDWVEGMEDGITKITLSKKFRIFSSRARAEEYLREELNPANYKNYADKVESMYTLTTTEEKKCQQ